MKKLAESIPQKFQEVIECGGNSTHNLNKVAAYVPVQKCE
jgi:hypothetical protein